MDNTEPLEDVNKGRVREFIKKKLWWWPAAVGLYSLFGLVVLYWYSGEIFSFMSAESAARYMVVTGSLLACLYIVTMILFFVRAVRRRRAKRESHAAVS